jgi:hypothetical protein
MMLMLQMVWIWICRKHNYHPQSCLTCIKSSLYYDMEQSHNKIMKYWRILNTILGCYITCNNVDEVPPLHLKLLLNSDYL